MEQFEKDIDLIEAFYQGKLKGKDLASFNQRRKEDPLFDEEVEDYILIFEGLRSQGERNFSDTLHNWEAEIEENKDTKVVPFRRYLAIAATLLILIIPITYWLVSEYNSKNSESLFMAYFEPYDDVVSVRSNQNNNLALGMSAYNNENYEKAIEYLQQVKDENPQKNAAELYLGISYLITNDTENAANILKSINKADQGLFKEIAEWHLALTYLKEEEEKLLKETLTIIIAQENHMYKEKAESLAKDID